jgi:hypothetical protein
MKHKRGKNKKKSTYNKHSQRLGAGQPITLASASLKVYRKDKQETWYCVIVCLFVLFVWLVSFYF